MSISLLLEMAISSDPERTAVVSGDVRLTTQQLSDLADGGAGVIAASGAAHVAYVGAGGAMLPLLIFASARAGLAFTPINYRLSAEGIQDADRPAARSAGGRRRPLPRRAGSAGSKCGQAVSWSPTTFWRRLATPSRPRSSPTRTSVGIVLFTSGTTSQPKAVELTHNNLTSYVTGTVEFGSAEPTDAALICVPPYHIAGVSAALSNLYAGRKMVYLPILRRARVGAPGRRRARDQRDGGADHAGPHRHGAGRRRPSSCRRCATWPTAVRRSRCRWCARHSNCCRDVGFVNAYGLTETSSTIAVLTPDDHREASGPPTTRPSPKRLGSVGQPVPGIEVQIRDEDGAVLGPGQTGELFVRGEQVSGQLHRDRLGARRRRAGSRPRTSPPSTTGGYLFIGGRSDDTIIRGGENIAPAELEDVLVEHPHVREVAVVGVEDPQWGQAIVAVVVPAAGVDPDPEELREHVRKSLAGFPHP